MVSAGVIMVILGAAFCSWFLVFCLFVANLVSQKTALGFLKYSGIAFGIVGIVSMVLGWL